MDRVIRRRQAQGKSLAEHDRHVEYTQLNSDVLRGTVTVDWAQMIEEHRRDKPVVRVVEVSLYEETLVPRHFQRLVGRCNSKQFTQSATDTFFLDTGKEIERTTLNKGIRNLEAFVN